MTMISLPTKTEIIDAIVEPNPSLPRPRFAPTTPGSEVTIKYWFYGGSPQYKVTTFDAFMAAYYPATGALAANDPVRPSYEAQYQSLKRLNDTFQPIKNAADQLAVLNHALRPWEKYGNLKFELATSAAAADIRILVGNYAADTSVNYRLTPPASENYLNEVVLNPQWFQAGALTDVSRGVREIFHEVGHAIGLAHPSRADIESSSDTLRNGQVAAAYSDYRLSIMSYNKAGRSSALGSISLDPPTTPMLFDLMSIESIYGLRSSVNAGDTTHRLDRSSGNKLKITEIFEETVE